MSLPKLYGAIALAIILLATCSSYAQSPWDFDSTSFSATVEIPPVARISANGTALTTSDAVGAYYIEDTTGAEIFVGATMLSDDTTTLVVYGQDTTGAGAGIPYGQEFFLRLFSVVDSCSYANTSIHGWDTTFVYFPFQSYAVDSLSSMSHTVFYSSTALCTSDFSTYLPQGSFASDSVVFFSSPGLDLTPEGLITPMTSLDGFYNIYIQSEFCVAPNEISILISNGPDVYLPLTIDTCANSPIEITPSSIDAVSYLWNGVDSGTTYSVEFSGSIELTAFDSIGCSNVFMTEVTFIDSIELPGVDFIIENASCSSDGSIQVDESLLPLPGSYTFQLDSITLSNGDNTFLNLSAGNYEVIITDSLGCSSTYPVDVNLIPEGLPQETLKITPASCSSLGSLELDNSIMIGGTPPFELLINGDTSMIHEVFPGFYNVAIIDASNCLFNIPMIEVPKIDDCQDYGFYPGTPGPEGMFVIEQTGVAKIFNRSGMLVMTLNSPTTWDGSDSSGALLPTGQYYIIVDDHDPIAISLLR